MIKRFFVLALIFIITFICNAQTDEGLQIIQDYEVDEILYLKAVSQFGKGRIVEAEESFGQLHEKFPESAFIDESYFYLAQISFLQEDYKDFLAQYNNTLPGDRDTLSFFYGVSLLMEQNTATAATVLAGLETGDRFYYQALYYRCLIHLYYSDFEWVSDSVAAEIDAVPQDAGQIADYLHLMQGLALMAQSRYEEGNEIISNLSDEWFYGRDELKLFTIWNLYKNKDFETARDIINQYFDIHKLQFFSNELQVLRTNIHFHTTDFSDYRTSVFFTEDTMQIVSFQDSTTVFIEDSLNTDYYEESTIQLIDKLNEIRDSLNNEVNYLSAFAANKLAKQLLRRIELMKMKMNYLQFRAERFLKHQEIKKNIYAGEIDKWKFNFEIEMLKADYFRTTAFLDSSSTVITDNKIYYDIEFQIEDLEILIPEIDKPDVADELMLILTDLYFYRDMMNHERDLDAYYKAYEDYWDNYDENTTEDEPVEPKLSLQNTIGYVKTTSEEVGQEWVKDYLQFVEGSCYFILGQYDEGIAVYDELLANESLHRDMASQIYLWIARYYFGQNDFMKARESLNSIQNGSKFSRDVLYLQGWIDYNEGLYDSSFVNFNKCYEKIRDSELEVMKEDCKRMFGKNLGQMGNLEQINAYLGGRYGNIDKEIKYSLIKQFLFDGNVNDAFTLIEDVLSAYPNEAENTMLSRIYNDDRFNKSGQSDDWDLVQMLLTGEQYLEFNPRQVFANMGIDKPLVSQEYHRISLPVFVTYFKRDIDFDILNPIAFDKFEDIIIIK